MNVSELYQLSHWIDDEIVANEILPRYEELRAILQTNSRANQQKQPFESQKNSLVEAVRRVRLETLSTEQLALLQTFGIADHVGEAAVAALEDILFRNVIDPATAVEKLDPIIEQIQGGIAKSTELKKALEGIVPPEPEIEGLILVRVTFAGEAEIGNIVDLKTWSTRWFDIGRGLAMLNDVSPEEVRVVGAGKGSIVIELAVGYGMAKTISFILLEALKVVEKVQDIEKKALEIKALKLSNAKIVKELEDEAKLEKKTGTDRIADKLSAPKAKKEGAEGDKVVAFRRAVRELVDFVEKGGEVDCVLPLEDATDGAEDKPDVKEIKELRATFKEIRQIEFHLKQLENTRSSADESSTTS